MSNDKITVRNAVVESAEIFRDLTHTTVTVMLSYGSQGSQGAGTHVLTEQLVRRLLEVAGADKWSQIPGKIVRARVSQENGVVALGHAIEEDWLDFASLGKDPVDDDLPM
jgi:hypothetical protein